jgi:BirA family biotin operon repressor/biotin-[acetyl-CoA-carboxylase] ligase
MIGEPFVILSNVESTNNHAKALIKAGLASNGMAIFAEEQTRGRGQKNHVWESQKGQNIILSVIEDASWLSLDSQFQLSCATALACRQLFGEFAGDETSIKWPNDIFWRDRKAGGILIENVIKGNSWDKTVIGIGMNINQVVFGEMKANPVSLKQVTGKTQEVQLLAKKLCTYLDEKINQLRTHKFDVLLEEYNHHLFKSNQIAVFRNEEGVFEAKVKGVNQKGQLCLEHKKFEIVDHGKIEWIL